MTSATVVARLDPVHDREAEVLALYASGETAERVARLLFISRETVLDHVRRIRTKYAAADRAAPTKVDLYRRAVEDGLVSRGVDADKVRYTGVVKRYETFAEMARLLARTDQIRADVEEGKIVLCIDRDDD